jgi:hypothetical protein
MVSAVWRVQYGKCSMVSTVWEYSMVPPHLSVCFSVFQYGTVWYSMVQYPHLSVCFSTRPRC